MTESPAFIPGLDLAEAFYQQAVGPLLAHHFPHLSYAAALVNYGSDVIGCDTPLSRDHGWGPRLQIFLRNDEVDLFAHKINDALRHNLPVSFMGYSPNFVSAATDGVPQMRPGDGGTIHHLIQIESLDTYINNELGVSPWDEPSTSSWLSFQEHRLLTLTSGRVFHDKIGLETVRRRFSFYPRDVWFYAMASLWNLLSQEEAFVGRTGDVDDDLGSRLITARLAHHMMQLCFLQERRYAPYSKWFGTVFQRLSCASKMTQLLQGALSAPDWHSREEWLTQAYRQVAHQHNDLHLTPHLSDEITLFYGRPYRVLFADRFADALKNQIEDPLLKTPAAVIGTVNQFLVESSNALQSVDFTKAIGMTFQPY